ncbi:hypothetical protein P8452_67207 [Trifolium repens]|nr:hypothetical protein P8452_67207 [Trifolium repens]
MPPTTTSREGGGGRKEKAAAGVTKLLHRQKSATTTTTPKQSPITTSHEHHPRRLPPSHSSPEQCAVGHQITTEARKQSNNSRSKTNQFTKNQITPNTPPELRKPNQKLPNPPLLLEKRKSPEIEAQHRTTTPHHIQTSPTLASKPNKKNQYTPAKANTHRNHYPQGQPKTQHPRDKNDHHLSINHQQPQKINSATNSRTKTSPPPEPRIAP